ncbi:hypothetical protein L7F22_032592 [Adiantum nelumboides]|nr:hypothetical protein [Adiantum nelumboides]
MMEEQQSKRAEREAKLRMMEETLDLTKAEMDARIAKLNKDGRWSFGFNKVDALSTKDYSRSNSSPEIYVAITLAGVLVAGFVTDAIGIHNIFGGYVFGLVIPKEGSFAALLNEKIEDFVTILMLPLYFATSG